MLFMHYCVVVVVVVSSLVVDLGKVQANKSTPGVPKLATAVKTSSFSLRKGSCLSFASHPRHQILQKCEPFCAGFFFSKLNIGLC